MSRRIPGLLASVAITIAACTSPAASSSATTTPTSSPTATHAPAAPATTRREVTLTDALRMDPAVMTVPAGVPVTFVVTNSGALDHEFYLGDEAAQQGHAVEMETMGGMLHDEPEGIGLKPGATKELTYTFLQPGETFAGCHVQGHYVAGMKAVITVE